MALNNIETLNNNGQNQFFWACKIEHPQQTIVSIKTLVSNLWRP